MRLQNVNQNEWYIPELEMVWLQLLFCPFIAHKSRRSRTLSGKIVRGFMLERLTAYRARKGITSFYPPFGQIRLDSCRVIKRSLVSRRQQKLPEESWQVAIRTRRGNNVLNRRVDSGEQVASVDIAGKDKIWNIVLGKQGGSSSH
jgi:hypothetical protein